jgi:hypothetical protein
MRDGRAVEVPDRGTKYVHTEPPKLVPLSERAAGLVSLTVTLMRGRLLERDGVPYRVYLPDGALMGQDVLDAVERVAMAEEEG